MISLRDLVRNDDLEKIGKKATQSGNEIKIVEWKHRSKTLISSPAM